MQWPRLDELSGFRRRFRITPSSGSVCCEVEDDYHCMSVVIRHDSVTALAIEPHMQRAPWTTCPGAEQQLRETFEGVSLADFPASGGKKANCTHLYDLAVLAAAHAADADQLVYDILVSDPIDGRRYAELRCDGQRVLNWIEENFVIVGPGELAGIKVFDMRAWINSLEPARREEARLLQWGTMLANGRSIPLADQSDATQMPPNCYTFQPQRAVHARRVGVVRDFSKGAEQPLGN